MRPPKQPPRSLKPNLDPADDHRGVRSDAARDNPHRAPFYDGSRLRPLQPKSALDEAVEAFLRKAGF